MDVFESIDCQCCVDGSSSFISLIRMTFNGLVSTAATSQLLQSLYSCYLISPVVVDYIPCSLFCYSPLRRYSSLACLFSFLCHLLLHFHYLSYLRFHLVFLGPKSSLVNQVIPAYDQDFPALVAVPCLMYSNLHQQQACHHLHVYVGSIDQTVRQENHLQQ